MNLKRHYIPFLLLFMACSAEKNTLTGNTYHNLTAHYNGYFYAREEVTNIEGKIRENNKDDYNKVLRLFPALDSTVATGYEKESQEAVKMASLAIQRHPNSKWVDDCYLLVGKARLYSLDWGNAIQTFKYVNGTSKKPDARHKAVVNLIRTFTEHQEFSNALAASDFLEKEKLSHGNLKDLLLEKAYLFQIQGDYDRMLRNLTAADPLLRKKDRPGRIYFIIGQVYQRLGFEAEAYNYYRKCLATNPIYEVDFYARLYMAQVAEISRSKSISLARKSFKKLLKDSKNKDFQDKIYYEMGVFEYKQHNIKEAMENYALALRKGSNKNIDGETYLRLGELYYDTLKNYEMAQAYYDSAIGLIPRDHENYKAIKARQEILGNLVKNLKTIQWQDSLLSMSSLDSVTLRNRIDSVLKSKAKAESSTGKKKKKKARIDIDPVANNIFSEDKEITENADWYFGNPSAVALGETEFVQIWGNIALEDHWRRSVKVTQITSPTTNPLSETGSNQQVPTVSNQSPSDPIMAEYTRIAPQIPRTEEEKNAVLHKIEEAYFNLGDIYLLSLNEKDNAIAAYQTLLTRFPSSEFEPETLYKLYHIFKDENPEVADQYARKLKEKHPNSTFTKILANPDYLQESSRIAEKQKSLYQKAYENFKIGEYALANKEAGDALLLGETLFSPTLELLKILIVGKLENVGQYQQGLKLFIDKYPDAQITPHAKTLLKTSEDFQSENNNVERIEFNQNLEGSHHFVICYPTGQKTEEVASKALEKFNGEHFKESKYKTTNLVLSDEYILTMTGEIPDFTTAKHYFRQFNEKLPTLSALKNHTFRIFVITLENFNTLYRTKSLDEYLRFFEKSYKTENP